MNACLSGWISTLLIDVTMANDWLKPRRWCEESLPYWPQMGEQRRIWHRAVGMRLQRPNRRQLLKFNLIGQLGGWIRMSCCCWCCGGAARLGEFSAHAIPYSGLHQPRSLRQGGVSDALRRRELFHGHPGLVSPGRSTPDLGQAWRRQRAWSDALDAVVALIAIYPAPPPGQRGSARQIAPTKPADVAAASRHAHAAAVDPRLLAGADVRRW